MIARRAYLYSIVMKRCEEGIGRLWLTRHGVMGDLGEHLSSTTVVRDVFCGASVTG